jgi:hypothetical protein
MILPLTNPRPRSIDAPGDRPSPQAVKLVAKWKVLVELTEADFVSAPAVCLAILYLDHRNAENGRLDPGQKGLAERLGCKVRAIKRLNEELEAIGFLNPFRPHRRRRNFYTIDFDWTAKKGTATLKAARNATSDVENTQENASRGVKNDTSRMVKNDTSRTPQYGTVTGVKNDTCTGVKNDTSRIREVETGNKSTSGESEILQQQPAFLEREGAHSQSGRAAKGASRDEGEDKGGLNGKGSDPIEAHPIGEPKPKSQTEPSARAQPKSTTRGTREVPPRPTPRPKVPLPDRWQPSAAAVAKAARLGLSDLQLYRSLRVFWNHARSKIGESADWGCEFDTWLNREIVWDADRLKVEREKAVKEQVSIAAEMMALGSLSIGAPPIRWVEFKREFTDISWALGYEVVTCEHEYALRLAPRKEAPAASQTNAAPATPVDEAATSIAVH